jgi:hypothetical protein
LGEITAKLDPKTPVEVWFHDEMRLGQKNQNARQSLRQNKLSNRIFRGYEAIVAAACDAWNSLIADPHHLDRHPLAGNHRS